MTLCDPGPAIAPCEICFGAAPGTALAAFHDQSWCIPRRSSASMFEALALAMVLWRRSPEPVLTRWPDMRRRMDGLIPERLARWRQPEIDQVLTGLRGGLERCTLTDLVINARVWRGFGVETGAAPHLWQSVGDQPVPGNWPSRADRPTITPLSRRLCGEMQAAGFRAMTPGKALNFMQNAGMVNDHVQGCPRRVLAG